MSEFRRRFNMLFLPALSAAVAVLMLGYSAYGWMTMSRSVTATGMNMKLTAPQFLEISATGEADDYHSTVAIDLEDIVADLNTGYDKDTNEFFMLPASSFEGMTFWKTDMANANGTPRCEEDEFENVSGDDGMIKYNSSGRIYEGYYLDIPIWLRAPTTVDKNIGISESLSEVTGNDGAKGIVRFAVLTEEQAAGAEITTPLVYAEAANCANVVTKNTDGKSKYVSPQYLTYSNGVSVQNVCRLDDSGGGEYDVQKLYVRIWIEGQDSNCKADVIGSNKTFSIQIGFVLKEN